MASTRLAQLAESLGCAEDMAARLAVHRVERAAFRKVMRAVDQHTETLVPDQLLPAPGETALVLLERILVARRVA